MSKTNLTCYIITLLFGIVAVILMSDVIKARRNRMEAVETKLEKLEGLDQQVLDNQRIVDNLEAELLINRKEWGRVWPNAGQAVVVNPDDGVVQLGIGANAGLGAAARNGGALPNLHLFGIDGGETRYIGEFQATAVDAADTVAKLERLPYDGEADKWITAGYRIRDAIPNSFNALEASLITERNIAAQNYLEEQKREERAQGQLAASQAVLQSRMNELNGDNAADPASDELLAKGLVKTIRDRTAERDSLNASVDRLRRVYSDKFEQLKDRLARVRNLASQLPGGGSADAAFNTAGQTPTSLQ